MSVMFDGIKANRLIWIYDFKKKVLDVHSYLFFFSTSFLSHCNVFFRKGQACAHVGALLFILTELVASGEEELPEDLSCTDVLCQWSETKNASVNPKILEDVTIREGSKFNQ